MPNPRYQDLSLAAQTGYAELLDQVRAQEVGRSIANLSGSFASKSVKGRRYWYYQYRDVGGGVRQLYVGPDDEDVRRLVEAAATKPLRALEPLCRSSIELGCAPILPKHFRIIRRLAEYGFFHAGGILVGTHAFLTLGNLLGIAWRDGARTLDLDLAHAGRNVSIALPANLRVDVKAAIDSLRMGFLPMTAMSGDATASFANPDDPELRIDLLTTRQRTSAPVRIDHLNVSLQPLKFIELILEHPVQGVALARDGAILVNVPRPERYAVHKLIVWAERDRTFSTKGTKDLAQAAGLIAYFLERRPEALLEAWRDLQQRGPGWRRRAARGLRALATLTPDLDLGPLSEPA
jgi:hypothetical protein